MIEIHAPHETVHTWKDFFIHIATICVGLLIAIGLEQTVEGLHHAHQRHLLLEALQRDTELCADDSRAAAGFAATHSSWLLEREKILNAALWKGHPPESLSDEPQRAFFELPSDPQFQSGKASGLLQLLSPTDMESFSEIDFMIGLSTDTRKTAYAARDRRRAFEHGFRGEDFQVSNLSKASPSELREYLRLIDEERIGTNQFLRMALETVGAATAVGKGERGLRTIQDDEIQAMSKDPTALSP